VSCWAAAVAITDLQHRWWPPEAVTSRASVVAGGQAHRRVGAAALDRDVEITGYGIVFSGDEASAPVQPGTCMNAEVAFIYAPEVDYRDLVVGPQFQIV
jgi:hypothetical protein